MNARSCCARDPRNRTITNNGTNRTMTCDCPSMSTPSPTSSDEEMNPNRAPKVCSNEACNTPTRHAVTKVERSASERIAQINAVATIMVLTMSDAESIASSELESAQKELKRHIRTNIHVSQTTAPSH